MIKLSSPESFSMTHRIRSLHDCILVGKGTIMHDNPSLTTRLVQGLSPRVIVVDSKLEISPNSSCISQFQNSNNRLPSKMPLIACLEDTTCCENFEQRAKVLKELGCELVAVPALGSFISHLDLYVLAMALKTNYSVQRIMVEGGLGILKGYMNQEKFAPHLFIITIAPRIVRGIGPFVNSTSPARIKEVHAFELGGDLIIYGLFDTVKQL